MLSTILKRDHARHHGKWPLRHTVQKGTAHLTKGGSSDGFLPQSTEEREKMDQEQALHFFCFFKKKTWSEARSFFFFFTIYLSHLQWNVFFKQTYSWAFLSDQQSSKFKMEISCHKVCFSMLLPVISAAWPSRVRSRPLWWLSLSNWILSKALGTSQGGCHLYFFLKVPSPWLSFIFPLSASICFQFSNPLVLCAPTQRTQSPSPPQHLLVPQC